MKRNILFSMGLLGALVAFGEIPAGYYQAIDGKKGDALAATINELSKGHTCIPYDGSYAGETWSAFKVTDVRTFSGKQIWWDMYSNNIVETTGSSGMNIEHSIPNSWWGGKSGDFTAYSDLILLNPSDAEANNKKSNYPMAEVADTRILDNGLSKIGTPVTGQGGGVNTAFEPADEYKGDFARAYFYVFTAYNDLASWQESYRYMYDTDCNLQPWAVELLLKWHRQDPVDSKEINRNEEIYKIQGNRNPFIDYPELAEYIWGDKKGTSVSVSGLKAAQAINRPAAPVFANSRAVAVNTYTARWWDGFSQEVKCKEGDLMLSLDGRDFYTPADASIYFDPALSATESHVIKAYATWTQDGYTLRSPISTLTLTAQDPDDIEYMTARWEQVTTDMDLVIEDEKFVILAQAANNVMSCDGGTSSSDKFMHSTGPVAIENGYIVELPADAALVEFEPVGTDTYSLKVSDMKGNKKGYWKNSGDKNMRINATSYTEGTWSLTDDNEFVFKFADGNGSLQYNVTQPRFLNYASNQGKVYLYRFVDMHGGETGIEDVTETPWEIVTDGNGIIAPEGTVIYDLNGRRVKGENLSPGIYIVTGAGRSVKIRL